MLLKVGFATSYLYLVVIVDGRQPDPGQVTSLEHICCISLFDDLESHLEGYGSSDCFSYLGILHAYS
jgi:hypothetical protein